MALKYFIQTTEPVAEYAAGELTGYTNGVDAVDSVTYDPAKEGFDFVKEGGTGFIGRERVQFITPYDDGVE